MLLHEKHAEMMSIYTIKMINKNTQKPDTTPANWASIEIPKIHAAFVVAARKFYKLESNSILKF